MKIFVFLLIFCGVINAINSSFYIPAIAHKNYFAVSLKGNFDPEYYLYQPSPKKFSIPALEGNLKLGKRAVFNIKYEYLLFDKRELTTDPNIIEKKSNATIGKNYAIGGGDVVTTVQFNLEKIRMENTDLLIETKWPNAEYESGFGTDMTDVSLRFINSYFYTKYHTTFNFGLKVVGEPETKNTQSDFFTVGLSFHYKDFIASINEDIGRYNMNHAMTDLRLQYQYKYLLVRAGASYTDALVNKSIEIGFIID